MHSEEILLPFSNSKTHQSLAPHFSQGLHRGAAICHIGHTVYTVYEQKYTTTKKKDLGTSVQWHRHSHNRNAHMHANTHTLFLPSELIYCCYSNIKVIMHSVKGEKAREKENCRGWETENVMVRVQL